MPIEFSEWENNVIEHGHKEGVKTKIIKHPSMGSTIERFTATIPIKYKEFELTITQGADIYNSCSPSYLQFECKTTCSENVYMYIYRQDFFSRIFGKNKIKTGNELFDKTFNIKSSHNAKALKLFKEEKIRQFFLSSPSVLFNINTEKGVTTISLRNVIKKLYSQKELQELLMVFKWIVDTVTHS